MQIIVFMLNIAQQRAGQKIFVILMNVVVQVDCVVVDFNIIPVIIIRSLAVHGDVIGKPIIANRRAVGVGVGVCRKNNRGTWETRQKEAASRKT